MTVRKLLAALAVAALPVVEARADVIDYGAAFDSVTDNFFPGVAGSGSHWTYLLSGSTPELTGTLNSGQQLRVTYSAPAGRQINILPKPASADHFGIFVSLWSEPVLSSPFVDTPGTSYSFTGLTGAPPTASSFQFTEAQGERFRAGLEFTTGGFSFQSLEMLFDIPPGYDRTFIDHVPGAPVFTVIAWWEIGSGAFDPGPLATITRAASEVPEPTALMLSAVAMSALAIRRRRRSEAGHRRG